MQDEKNGEDLPTGLGGHRVTGGKQETGTGESATQRGGDDPKESVGVSLGQWIL